MSGQITRLYAPCRSRAELRRAARNRADLVDALLRCQQVKVSVGCNLLLLNQGFVNVGLSRLCVALRCQCAQLALVTALPGPVHANGLVNALLPDQIAATNAIL